MEASSPEQQGPSPSPPLSLAEQDAPTVCRTENQQQCNAEIPSKHHDVERPIEPQEHYQKPPIEETVPPHTSPSLVQDHHEEHSIAEPHHSNPVPEMSSSPQHHHLHLSSSQEHDKETSLRKTSTETPSDNNVPKPSAVAEGHQKEFPSKGGIDTPPEQHHKHEPDTEPLTDNGSLGQHHEVESPSESSLTKGSPVASHQTQPPSPEVQLTSASPPQQTSAPHTLLQHQAHHAIDPVEAQLDTDTEVKLTSSQEAKLTLALEQQGSAIRLEQSSDVILKHSEEVSKNLPQKQPQDQGIVGSLTVEGDVEPLAKKHTAAEDFEASSTSSQQEAESQQQFGARGSLPITALSPEVRSTEEPPAKESQSLTLQSSQKPARAEIDTAAPFESVKAAVSLFGERMDWKSQTRPPQSHVPSVERRALPESELQKVQDELLLSKDQLALAQASTAGVLLELRKVKRLIQNPANKPGGSDILSYKSLEAADTLNNSGVVSMDKPNHELMTVMREVESVKEELVSVSVSKEAAVKRLQDALSSLNLVLRRVDELSGEKMSLEEAVADAHIALADAEEQVALLKSGHRVDKLNTMPSDVMEKKSVEIKGLESKLEEAKATIATLKDELAVSKNAESVVITATSDTQRKMAKVMLELDEAKSKELSIVGRLASVLEESDELKAKLEKAVQDNAALSATIERLKLDVDQCRKELESMHEKEQTACVTLASLQDELQKVKEALKSAQAGEARALEAKDKLPSAIKQAASEADEAKAAAEASKEEARRARQEIEQARAATSTANSRQQAALKELEAFKASEAMALAELKALTESESQSEHMEAQSDGLTGVIISLEEYSALKQAAVEAEGLANKKVAEVTARVEEAKASQEKAQAKLEEAAREAEKCREELDKAQKQADDAQEAKLTAEGDLRKWRAEHDQRRRSGGPPDPKMATVKNPPLRVSEEEKLAKLAACDKEDIVPPLVQGKKTGGRDSLAQVMSLEVPASERLERVMTIESSTKGNEKGKKRNLIRRITAIVALKK